jgi:hypothetical protein
MWQSIKTAPRDGTPVLLKRDDLFPFVGSWREATRDEPEPDEGKCWRARCCGRADNPSHWAPLPTT